MLQIDCPYCGTRDEVEYSYGGEAHVTRPEPDVNDDAWSDYLFNRGNPKGIHYERWSHTFGCGQWFNIARSTITHEIHAVYEMGRPPPEVAVGNRAAERKLA